jgi:hypothetical protein
MQEKPFVWDSKMKHKIELMIILLIITVIGNIAVYYFNHKYEKGGSYAKSEEVVKEPSPTLTVVPTEAPIASTGAILRDCTLFETPDYTLCLPKTWLTTRVSTVSTKFQPKSIPTGTSANYLTITIGTDKLTPLPTPRKTYTVYKKLMIGATQAYRTDYIPQKSSDGFIIPLEGCQDPYEILVPAGKQTLRITSCKEYESATKAILDSILTKS